MITDINLTLIIQMINFIIAYMIIRVFLLKPAMAVINEEQEARARSQETINNSLRANEAKEDTMNRRWTYCQKECHLMAPSPDHADELLVKKGTPQLEIPDIDTATQNTLATSIAKSLVQRMSNVR